LANFHLPSSNYLGSEPNLFYYPRGLLGFAGNLAPQLFSLVLGFHSMAVGIRKSRSKASFYPNALLILETSRNQLAEQVTTRRLIEAAIWMQVTLN
jgi:hypothetical protein